MLVASNDGRCVFVLFQHAERSFSMKRFMAFMSIQSLFSFLYIGGDRFRLPCWLLLLFLLVEIPLAGAFAQYVENVAGVDLGRVQQESQGQYRNDPPPTPSRVALLETIGHIDRVQDHHANRNDCLEGEGLDSRHVKQDGMPLGKQVEPKDKECHKGDLFRCGVKAQQQGQSQVEGVARIVQGSHYQLDQEEG